MKELRAYIKNNWKRTIRNPQDMSGDFKVPKPFISPSIGGGFVDLYYWDVYFINLGLLIDGELEQVENNLDNIAFFIDKLGFMPNANIYPDRSQPPLFCHAVYDYYMATMDESIIKKYLPYILKEYDFWQSKRNTPYGLNVFSTNGDTAYLLYAYNWLSDRVMEKRDTEEEKIILGKDILAIAESGLDFNMRFRTKDSKLDAHKFLHLDLNCYLFDVETTLAKMLHIIKDFEQEKLFLHNAERRKQLINQYFLNKDTEIYLDYNVATKGFSEICSAVSLYPYTYGISKDKAAVQKILKTLEYENGVTVTPNRGKDVYYQWDYPCMWAAATWQIYIALKNVGLVEDAVRIAKKYMTTVERIFEKTGIIWEKYDAVTGEIGCNVEGETGEMLGWTAGVYVYFDNELNTL